MTFVALNILALVAATVVCEYLWYAKKIRSEDARKIMHIFGGLLAAFWPLYLSWNAVQFLIVVAIFAIAAMRLTGLVRSLFAVRRHSMGDILAPLTIGVLAFFEPPVVLFVLVVLHMALADGMAAVIGTRYGKTSTYKVLGYQKSVVGTLTCFLFSWLIVFGVYTVGHFGGSVSPSALILIPAAVATVENIGVFGVDNMLIAIVVGLLANQFGFF